jgi:hypothetical protein
MINGNFGVLEKPKTTPRRQVLSNSLEVKRSIPIKERGSVKGLRAAQNELGQKVSFWGNAATSTAVAVSKTDN